ncbi:hypothetical protein [Micromonospora sp. NPDC023633]|uniref:hypothetical protein n=1 Tax=Micromonospora sp. NPDC023633 TaxID=3154320 RepID=UPI0033D74371
MMDDQAGSPVPGCSLPADVDGLLDAYADDPVLAVTPDGAQRVGDVARSRGCRRLNKEDVSSTSVSLSWRPDRDWGNAELRRTYDPVADAAGWRYAEIPDRGPAVDGESFLSWCRSVRDVPSRLIVRSNPTQRVDVRPSSADRSPSPQWSVASPAGIYLTIFADQACPAS